MDTYFSEPFGNYHMCGFVGSWPELAQVLVAASGPQAAHVIAPEGLFIFSASLQLSLEK